MGRKRRNFFVGKHSLVTDVYPMHSISEFVNTLEDHIRARGAMDRLLTDSAAVEISQKVENFLRAYAITSWQSEAYHQHQNPAERRIGTMLNATNNILNHSGAPETMWLLALQYVCYLYNHLAHASLGWKTPLQALMGTTPDITALLQFSFWERVYYHVDDSSFPSDSTERPGRFVGIAETVGDAMTYKIYTEDTHKMINYDRLS